MIKAKFGRSFAKIWLLEPQEKGSFSHHDNVKDLISQ